MGNWPALAAIVQSTAQTIMGEATTYTPAGNAPESITGIFEGAHVELDLSNAVQSTYPALSVHLTDLAVSPSVGDAITVRGVGYTIAEIQPDGQGDVMLVLEAV